MLRAYAFARKAKPPVRVNRPAASSTSQIAPRSPKSAGLRHIRVSVANAEQVVSTGEGELLSECYREVIAGVEKTTIT
jgi:hypothetical protein